MKQLNVLMNETLKEIESYSRQKTKIYRFDVFKGKEDENGNIVKVRSVGTAQLAETAATYSVYIKSLLKDVFYLMPEKKFKEQGEYTILTRSEHTFGNKKYSWNVVGMCQVLTSNFNLMKMSWDFFGADDIYINLIPIAVIEKENSEPKAA